MRMIQTLAAVLLATSSLLANAIPLQYTGIGAVPGGGISLGDTISISFDYDSSTGFSNTSGPGQLGYVGALSNIVISTTAAIPTTALSSFVAVANVNVFGFEGYQVGFSLGNSTFLNMVLPFDIPGTSLALPNTLPSSSQIDLSRLGTVPALAAAGIAFQYQDSANQTQFAWFDFAPVSSVPEPTTLSLLGAGLFGFGLMRRRRRVV